MSTTLHKSNTPTKERTPAQKKLDKEVLERVKKGMALLQKEYGDGWVEKIDLGKLDLADGSCCVLGQVYDNERPGEGYWWALRNLEGLHGRDDSEYGFCISGDYDPDENDWDHLQETWVHVLTPMVEKRIG